MAALSQERYEKFLSALEALCIEHKAQLATSLCDSIVVSDLVEGERCLYECNIEKADD